jgi:hypothetical protein
MLGCMRRFSGKQIITKLLKSMTRMEPSLFHSKNGLTGWVIVSASSVVYPITECDFLLGLRLCSLLSSFRPHGKVECSHLFALYPDTFTIFVDHCRYARCRRMARRHWRQPRNGHMDQQPENSLSLRRGAGRRIGQICRGLCRSVHQRQPSDEGLRLLLGEGQFLSGATTLLNFECCECDRILFMRLRWPSIS